MMAGVQLFATFSALLAFCGIMSVLVGAISVHRFAHQGRPRTTSCPAVTILRPLCGDEPMLMAALTTICQQAYPEYQIVVGVQDPHDPALAHVRRLQVLHPECDITVVVNQDSHGPNRKVGNLINMLPYAKHDLLVFSDSDLHVAPDYLQEIVAALQEPGTGLVTTLCTGLPTVVGLMGRLGALGISYSFMPGALMARMLGREDCLGTTMALHRSTLARVGGLETLVGHLADDYLLATRVKQLGLHVGLAATVPMTAVPERTVQELWQHETRWARTIRAWEPVLYGLSVIQFPLFWAAMAFVCSAGRFWSVELFAATWTVRAAAAYCVSHTLQLSGRRRGEVFPWLFPLRDLLSVAEIVASYWSGRVVWRGHVLQADEKRS
jgi:ceramide glucosyltransferase